MTQQLFKDRPVIKLKAFTASPAVTRSPAAPASEPVSDQGRKPPRLPTALRIEIDRRRQDLGAELSRCFPKCFAAEGETPKPLKINIKPDILAAMPDVDPHDLINVLTAYCGSPEYHTAIIASTDRIDLDGGAAGPVSASGKRHSARKLAKLSTTTTT